jgi:hypothetical protein
VSKGILDEPDRPTRSQKLLVLGMLTVLPAGALLLYFFPPTRGSFYPPCFFHLTTGLHCPGCGTTRCLHALVHGDVLQAAAFNFLMLLALPPICYWAITTSYAVLHGRRPKTRRWPRWALTLLLLVFVSYGILRNLPFPPFELLAPHVLPR